MRIPLDYYRILGLPIQANVEQLQQAYRDSALQLPRREYSGSAVAARKKLLEEAYTVLSDLEERSRYDANYFDHTYEREAQAEPATAELHPELAPPRFEYPTPSIEISHDLFVGALLILQELGEYELVLNLGCSYLSTNTDSEKSESNQVRADIVLTVALACLELGREQWQQRQYEQAATTLEKGQELLSHEDLFPSVGDEIQSDLYKLRPYLILELLARSENNVARSQGLKLLQKVLQERGGIDGTGNDGSGLSLDDFLRFMQQLRSYLTAAEQQSLFEAESQRPSAVASYLLVYALIARGFAQRQPALIRKAKLLLIRLGKRQDLHLEQAVCSLLLGQTEVASRALELSHDYEPLAFIREHSQGSPDLLPGLCLYGERWLQTEVFPHFRDLAKQQASLKDYYADEQVQSYLEALPTVEATDELAVVTPLSNDYVRGTHLPRSGESAALAKSSGANERLQNTPQDMGPSTYSTAVANSNSLHATTILTAPPENNAVVPAVRKVTTDQTNASALVVPPSGRSRRRTRDRQTGRVKHSVLNWVGNVLKPKKTRLALLAVAGLLGIVMLGFLTSQAYSLLSQTFFRAPSLPQLPTKIQLEPIPSPIPDASSKPTAELLTQETAQQVIQSWLSTKTVAFGSNHAADTLKQILVEPALSQWQRTVQTDIANNRYRQYKHSLKVMQVSKATLTQAQVEASIDEVAQVYENGRLKQSLSYNDQNLRVQYDLVRKDGEWLIQKMMVLK